MEEKHKKRYVVDSSFVLCYLLPDESNPLVENIFVAYSDGSINLLSVSLLPFEVINGMYAATLTKRVDQKRARLLIDGFLQLPIQLVDCNIGSAYDLAMHNQLSVYDASYLSLAAQYDVQLLTLDKQLQKRVQTKKTKQHET